MERITAKEVTSMMQAVAQVYEQPEQSEDNTILEFEDTEYLQAQLKADRDKKRAEAQAARDRIASGQSITARTGLIGTDTLKKSGTTADGRTILDVKRGGGIQIAPPDKSTVIGNQRYDRLTTTGPDGRIRYQYVQAQGPEGQVANPKLADPKPEKETKPEAETKPAETKPASNSSRESIWF